MTLTNVLILINVLAYIWESTTGGGIDHDHGDLYGPYVVEYGEWWRIVTSAFLHASLTHIAFNMIALYQLGNSVEVVYGRLRFLLLYVIAMIGSGIAVLTFAYATPTLGASGAIFGLFGALIAVGLRLRDARGRALIMQVVPIVAINLIFTFAVPGISIAGHLGGLATGLVAGLLLFRMPVVQQRPAYAYAFAPQSEAAQTIEHPPVEAAQTIEHAPIHEQTIEYPPYDGHTIEHPPFAEQTIEHPPYSEPTVE
jgi:membrane associated rhomboid family serine protease